MAINISTKLTDGGINKLTNALVSTIPINITKWEISSTPAIVLNPALTSLPGPIVDSGTSAELSFDLMSSNQVNIRLNLDESMGPYDIGSIGLYSDDDTLIVITTLSEVIPKQPNAVGVVGNRYTLFVPITFTNIGEAVNFSILSTVFASWPYVQTIADLPDANLAPFEGYIVREDPSQARPITAIRNEYPANSGLFIWTFDYHNSITADDNTESDNYKIDIITKDHVWTSNLMEVMRLQSSTGNLGIGITPSFKLDVAGNVNINFGSTYKINSLDVLSSTTLGSGVVNSSLTSVGTLTSLNVSGNTGLGGTAFSGGKLTVSDNSSAAWKFILGSSTSELQARDHLDSAYTSAIYDATQHSFQESGVEILRISSGKVLLGTTITTLAEKMHISTGSFGCDASDINTSHNDLIIENSGGAGVVFLVNNATGGAGIIVNSETSNLTANQVTNAMIAYMADKRWDIYTGGANNIRFNPTHTMAGGLGGSPVTKAIEVSGDSTGATENTIYNASSGNTVTMGVFGTTPGANRTAGAGFIADFGEVPAIQWNNQQVILQKGSAALPSLTFQGEIASDTGIYSSGDGTLNFSTDGTEKLRINNIGQLRLTNEGSASAPAIYFNIESDTGIYSDSSDICISNNSSFVARFNDIFGIHSPLGVTIGTGTSHLARFFTGYIDSAGNETGALSATQTGTGEYTITHNFNSLSYSVNLTCHSIGAFVYIVNIVNKGLNSISYRIKSSTDILVNTSVDYTIIRFN